MDNWYIVVTTIIFVILYFLNLLLKNFFPSFFGESGKNLATKRDIRDITKIVEETKIEFTKQTEKLRADLTLTNQHTLNWKNSQREALIDFNKKTLSWIYFIHGFRLKTFNRNNYQDLKDENIEIRRKHIEFNISNAHLSLFIIDDDFDNLRKDFILTLIDYSETLKNGMVDVFTLNSEAVEFNYWGALSDNPKDSAGVKILAKSIKDIEFAVEKCNDELDIIYTQLEKKHQNLNKYLNIKLKSLHDTN